MPIQTIVILDHHQSNDQRISRHMQFCIKSGYDITRINFTIQENKKKGKQSLLQIPNRYQYFFR